MKRLHLKERITNFSGSISGIMGFLGSYQVCHSICIGLIALLSALGIAAIGIPLLFLTKVAAYFWAAALVLLVVAFVMYLKTRCTSHRVLFFNSGLVIAGTPSQLAGNYSIYPIIIGAIVILVSIALFIRKTIHKRQMRARRSKR